MEWHSLVCLLFMRGWGRRPHWMVIGTEWSLESHVLPPRTHSYNNNNNNYYHYHYYYYCCCCYYYYYCTIIDKKQEV